MIGWTNDCIYKWVHNDNMVERSFVMRCAIERRGHREWTLRCCVTVSTFLSNKLFHFILNDAKSLKVSSKNAIRNWDEKKYDNNTYQVNIINKDEKGTTETVFLVFWSQFTAAINVISFVLFFKIEMFFFSLHLTDRNALF